MYIPSLLLNTVLDVNVEDAVVVLFVDVVFVFVVVVVVEDLVSSLSLMG